MLVAAECNNFVLECLDINSNMLQRGKELAEQKSLEKYMRFVTEDASSWAPPEEAFGVVMAHQSLHHIVDLELFFEKIKKSLSKQGKFLTSDIIGRNGHMRWPEAMRRIDEIWADMPERYKYNHALKRFEGKYENWDCSTDGFEGIRAQDVLPLLRRYFEFEMFLGYGNLIDIFVDRAFGHNFDPASQEDQRFIDKVALLDDQLIESGELKPTHIIAVMGNAQVENPRVYRHLTPEFCTREATLLERSSR
jgi:SAM-dependent methyltransferase